jgi:hypothetical protein
MFIENPLNKNSVSDIFASFGDENAALWVK